MYLVAIGWLYVALMMAVAEATNSTGTVLGAIVTFVLYGLLPVALVLYLLGTPMRRRALRAREDAEWRASREAAAAPEREAAVDPNARPSDPPDEGREAAALPTVPPVRKEP